MGSCSYLRVHEDDDTHVEIEFGLNGVQLHAPLRERNPNVEFLMQWPGQPINDPIMLKMSEDMTPYEKDLWIQSKKRVDVYMEYFRIIQEQGPRREILLALVEQGPPPTRGEVDWVNPKPKKYTPRVWESSSPIVTHLLFDDYWPSFLKQADRYLSPKRKTIEREEKCPFVLKLHKMPEDRNSIPLPSLAQTDDSTLGPVEKYVRPKIIAPRMPPVPEGKHRKVRNKPRTLVRQSKANEEEEKSALEVSQIFDPVIVDLINALMREKAAEQEIFEKNLAQNEVVEVALPSEVVECDEEPVQSHQQKNTVGKQFTGKKRPAPDYALYFPLEAIREEPEEEEEEKTAVASNNINLRPIIYGDDDDDYAFLLPPMPKTPQYRGITPYEEYLNYQEMKKKARFENLLDSKSKKEVGKKSLEESHYDYIDFSPEDTGSAKRITKLYFPQHGIPEMTLNKVKQFCKELRYTPWNRIIELRERGYFKAEIISQTHKHAYLYKLLDNSYKMYTDNKRIHGYYKIFDTIDEIPSYKHIRDFNRRIRPLCKFSAIKLACIFGLTNNSDFTKAWKQAGL